MEKQKRSKPRYQQKQEQGLVPFHYDKNSKSFLEGAFKNWPHKRDPVTRQIIWTQNEADRAANNDAEFLRRARENR